ncbi:lipase domain protein, putative [Rhizoctonia solani AG-3 Rhs1AP]|uniref:Lipase domain protein, putative n=1 Tax=Rhizoctonia solani AG-3 Rhs1AP TaxID=1086054 RepID=X8JDU2_9AGAM|nr:lipase domain protein, putative [Rhizoctonia solani AG-3 Rhs1AP]
MPPIRQRGPVGSSSSASSQYNGIGAKSVWFYMTGSKVSTRPHDDELQLYFEEDNQRQKSGLTYQRPQDVRIRCVVCLLEKDKWQTWHNRAGPIAKMLRQHLDGRHAIICSDDGGDQNTESQQSTKPAAKSKFSSAPTESSTTEASQSSVEAPRFGYSKTASQAMTSKLPTPSSSESQNEEPYKPHPRAPKSVEKLRAELDKVKAECEQAKAERDEATHERQLLKEEVRRLKEAERVKDEQLLKLSNLVSSSLKALVKK